jgi:succinoglycan biosynthesis transport protein ExoP
MGAAGDQTLDVVAGAWCRRKWLALSVFAVTAAAGATVALSLPNVYRSTAVVVASPARTDAADPADLESRLQLVSQEILSRSSLEQLIRRFDLYPHLRRGASLEDAVGQARRDIRSEPKVQPQPSGIGATLSLAVSYRGRDPEVTAKVANAVAALYVDQDRTIREREAGTTAQTLKAQLDEIKGNLQVQEKALAQFQDQHVGELAQETDANQANLDRLQAELRTASDERIRAIERRNDLLKEITQAEETGTGGGPAPTSPSARLARKKAELADLSRRYSSKYPDVIRLREEVAALETEVRESGSLATTAEGGGSARPAPSLRGSLREVEAEIAGLKADEARLRERIAELIRRLENVPRRQRDYQQIARDYQTTRDVYDSVRKRYEQAQLEDVGGTRGGLSRFRILDPALVPTDPVAPNRLFLLFLSLAGALALAVAAAALAEWLDTSFHSGEDLRSFTRVPIAAGIPLIVTPRDLRVQRRNVLVAVVSVLIGVTLVIPALRHAARTSDGVAALLERGRP